MACSLLSGFKLSVRESGSEVRASEVDVVGNIGFLVPCWGYVKNDHF